MGALAPRVRSSPEEGLDGVDLVARVVFAPQGTCGGSNAALDRPQGQKEKRERGKKSDLDFLRESPPSPWQGEKTHEKRSVDYLSRVLPSASVSHAVKETQKLSCCLSFFLV